MMLGQKIKKIRELKNLTQEHLATELGLTQSTYSKMESGEVDIPYNRLEQISKVLNLSPEDIIAFNEQLVFNVMYNKPANDMIVYQSSAGEKKVYEEHIKQLQNENAYLKSILDKMLLSDKKGK